MGAGEEMFQWAIRPKRRNMRNWSIEQAYSLNGFEKMRV
ncbi:hypothetical protein QG37_06667 [Candidozyma auris]|uniref:Uncharacterized protein n=1 Tax=Candidozyma auris TaxID=498019 RepID=A0A0L0NS34_CANAR|nr:hypothetical protein QG37_06667 [[Candida] auris]